MLEKGAFQNDENSVEGGQYGPAVELCLNVTYCTDWVA